MSVATMNAAPSITDEAFEQSLARGYNNQTWLSTATGAFLLFVSVGATFLIPGSVPIIKPGVVHMAWMMGLAGGLAGLVRVVRMPTDLRQAANVGELAVQAAMSGLITLIGAAPYLFALAMFLVAWVTALIA